MHIIVSNYAFLSLPTCNTEMQCTLQKQYWVLSFIQFSLLNSFIFFSTLNTVFWKKFNIIFLHIIPNTRLIRNSNKHFIGKISSTFPALVFICLREKGENDARSCLCFQWYNIFHSNPCFSNYFILSLIFNEVLSNM